MVFMVHFSKSHVTRYTLHKLTFDKFVYFVFQRLGVKQVHPFYEEVPL
jgi:hypothetical protein